MYSFIYHTHELIIVEDLSKFCCQNASCDAYGIRNHSNLTVTARYGKNKMTRMLRCSICKARFSENKGTVFFRARLQKKEVINILAHIREGNGIRRTSRLCDHAKETVSRYVKFAGLHALHLHDELVEISP